MTTVESVKHYVQVSVGEGQSTVTFGASRVEVSPDGMKVIAYTNDGVETKAATNGAAAAEGTLISVSNDFNTVVLYGVTIERAADGHLVIAAPGTVITKPGPSNEKALEIGDKREDGWAYVGVGEDGKDVFAKGYGVKKWEEAMRFAADNDAHLGSDFELGLLQKTLKKGLLKDSFDLSGSAPSGWVWGSCSNPNDLNASARVQCLNDGYRGWVSQGKQASTVLFWSPER